MAKTCCIVFSQRTGTIAILSFPVICFLLFCCVRLFVDPESFYGLDVWKAEVPAMILVCFCFIGLIGVEHEKPSFLNPIIFILLALFLFIFGDLITNVIRYLVSGKSSVPNNGYLFGSMIALMLMWSAGTIANHQAELFEQKSSSLKAPPQIDV